MRKTMSFALSCGVLGVIYGTACATYDIPPFLAFFCCIVVFSGAVQYATLAMLDHDPSLPALVLASTFVSLRLFLMGVSLAPMLPVGVNWRTVLAIPVISDGNWAAMLRERDNPDRFAFFVGSGFWMLAWWALGAYAGSFAASHIAMTGEFTLVFSGTVFLVLLAMTVAKADGSGPWSERIAWIVATACAAVVSLVLPFTLSAIAGLVVGGLVAYSGTSASEDAPSCDEDD